MGGHMFDQPPLARTIRTQLKPWHMNQNQLAIPLIPPCLLLGLTREPLLPILAFRPPRTPFGAAQTYKVCWLRFLSRPILYPPQPSGDLALAFLTLERLIMLPHVRVVFSLFSKVQIANVAFPG